MNHESTDRECACWRVTLPPRETDFASACACAENCGCRTRRRVGTTVAVLLVCAGAGVAAGLRSAGSADAAHLASLRRIYLERLDTGGPGR